MYGVHYVKAFQQIKFFELMPPFRVLRRPVQSLLRVTRGARPRSLRTPRRYPDGVFPASARIRRWVSGWDAAG